MGAILGALITTVAKDAITGVVSDTKRRISKTKAGVNVLGAAGMVAIDWAGLFSGDPQAIGTLVVMIAGWVMTLYGRWKADKA